MTPEAWAELRESIQDERAICYEHGDDLVDAGKRDEAERPYGQVQAFDDVLAMMDRLEREAGR